jgi:hypothetical protein
MVVKNQYFLGKCFNINALDKQFSGVYENTRKLKNRNLVNTVFYSRDSGRNLQNPHACLAWPVLFALCRASGGGQRCIQSASSALHGTYPALRWESHCICYENSSPTLCMVGSSWSTSLPADPMSVARA